MSSFTGIVTAIKSGADPSKTIYTVVGDRIANIRSGIMLELLDTVEVQNMPPQGNALADVKVLEKASAPKYKACLSKKLRELGFASSLQKRCKMYNREELDSVTRNMAKGLAKAAVDFARAFLTGAPVVIRFHNDCDGSSGALALYENMLDLQKRAGYGAENVFWRMNPSIAYAKASLQNDELAFNGFRSAEKPVVFITDFGTTPESDDAISAAGGKYNLIWLDHHPVHEGFPKEKIGHYINPWDFGGNSDYTAGFLTSTFSELLGTMNVNVIKEASLIGDYSAYANRGDKEAHKLSIVLDFLTSGDKGRKPTGDSADLTPKYISNIVDNKDEYESLYGHAAMLLDEALDIGLEKIRHYNANGISVHLLDFKHISREKTSWPLPGRYSSRLQERLEALDNGKTITIVHYGNFISVRISRDITDQVEILKKMAELKERTEHIHAFGGHKSAAGIRSDKDHVEDTVNLLLKSLGVTTR